MTEPSRTPYGFAAAANPKVPRNVEDHNMKVRTQRILGALAGGFIGAIACVIYRLVTSGIHIGSAADILLLPLPGLIVDALLGAVFPRPFMWVAGQILDAWP